MVSRRIILFQRITLIDTIFRSPGRCCAYDIYPEDSDMGEVANPNYVCMTWETSDKKQGNGPPTMPKTKIMPFPIICPSTLANCYSKNYYSPGSTVSISSVHHFENIELISCRCRWLAKQTIFLLLLVFGDHQNRQRRQTVVVECTCGVVSTLQLNIDLLQC